MSSQPLRILLTGATGRLGGALARHYAGRYELIIPTRAELDLNVPSTLSKSLANWDFDVLIHSAASSSPDICEAAPDQAWRVNAESPAILAQHCQERGIRLLHISTDYVFSGAVHTPLSEEDTTHPINLYGQTKRSAELAVLQACPSACVARVSWLFGPDKSSFPDSILHNALAGKPVRAIDDKWSTPTSCDDLAQWLEVLFTSHSHVQGILHLCNNGQATWKEYAEVTLQLAGEAGLPILTREVEGHSMIGFPPFKAARPPFTVMSLQKLTRLTGISPRPWQDALRDYIATQKKA